MRTNLLKAIGLAACMAVATLAQAQQPQAQQPGQSPQNQCAEQNEVIASYAVEQANSRLREAALAKALKDERAARPAPAKSPGESKAPSEQPGHK